MSVPVAPTHLLDLLAQLAGLGSVAVSHMPLELLQVLHDPAKLVC